MKYHGIEITNIEIFGVPLVQWKYKQCVAEFGVNEQENWATLCTIRSLSEGKGHATHVLAEAKTFYESQGKRFGGSVALNSRMKAIYQRLGVTEYC